jgi:hypothetical protein
MRFILVVSLLLLQGCYSVTPKNLTSPDWLSDHITKQNLDTGSGACEAPTGTFNNSGQSNKPETSHPTLAQLLFENGLAGYPVESVAISSQPNGDLAVDGILGGVPLKMVKVVEYQQAKNCEARWPVKVPVDSIDGYGRTQALFYTGGLIVPLKEFNEINLIRAADGSLLIEVTNSAWILGALSIPFKVDNKYWMRFQHVENQRLLNEK